jgi:WD40 repeat protein
MAFDAFISYSHAADGRLAPSLQRAIQLLAKPWYRPRALRVFRDESALSANPHLWSSIETALDESEWFVLLASPDAAASEWVTRELDHWLANKSADQILVVLTDGTLEWDAQAHALTGTAVPDALRHVFADEPRHVDLRWAATETDLDMHHARFRDVVAQLAAPIHGIARDELDSEDVRQHRRARRFARGGVSVLALLVVISLVATTFAFVQRRRANDRANAATAQQLAALATNRVVTDPALAMLLAADGLRRDESPGTRAALLSVLTRSPQLVGFMPGTDENTARSAISPDGKLVAAGATDGSVRFWHSDRPFAVSTRVPPPATLGGQEVVDVIFDPAGKRLYTLHNDLRVQAWDTDAESAIGPPMDLVAEGQPRLNPGAVRGVDIGISGGALALSPDGRYLALATSQTSDAVAVREWDLVRGHRLGSCCAADNLGWPVGGVAYSADGNTIFVSSNQGLMPVDASTMRLRLPPVAVGGQNGFAYAPLAAGTVRRGRSIILNGNEIIDLSTGKVLQRTNAARRQSPPVSVPPIAMSADGTFTVTASDASGVNDGSISVVDTVSGQTLGPPLHAPGGAITSLSLARDKRLVSTAKDGSVALWDLVADGGSASSPAFDLGKLHPGGWPPNERLGLLSGSPVSSSVPLTLAMSADGTRLAALALPSLEIRPTKRSDPIFHDRVDEVFAETDDSLPTGRPYFLSPLQFDPAGRRVRYEAVTLSTSRRESSLTRGQLIQLLLEPDNRDTLKNLSRNDRWSNGPGPYAVARPTKSSGIVVVDTWSGRRFAKLHGNTGVLNRLSHATVDANARYAVGISVGISDSRIALWDARSGAPIGKPVAISTVGANRSSDFGQQLEVTTAAISADGKELAVTNGGLARYSLPSLRRIGAVLRGPSGPVAYQPGGSLLAAVDGESVDLIDRSLGQVVATIAFPSQARRTNFIDPTVQFDAAGKTLLTRGFADSHPALLWSTVPSEWVRAACRIAGRNLTRTEWKQIVGGKVPYRRTCAEWPAGT